MTDYPIQNGFRIEMYPLQKRGPKAFDEAAFVAAMETFQKKYESSKEAAREHFYKYIGSPITLPHEYDEYTKRREARFIKRTEHWSKAINEYPSNSLSSNST